MIVGSIRENTTLEKRVSLTPESAKNIIGLGLKVCVEKGYALHLGIDDNEFSDIGVEIKSSSNEVLNSSDLIIKVNCPLDDEIGILKNNTILIGMLNPSKNKNQIDKIINKKIKLFSLELLPRITRAQSMDVLSSQSNLAGYKAVIEAASLFKKALPMMMTAAGTIIPAKCLILGAGVAGLQAIATAKRLGCMVSAFDVRPEVEAQVKSLGSKFIKVENAEQKNVSSKGYAKEMDSDYKIKQLEKIHQAAIESDIIITTALIPGKEAPKLLLSKTIKKMRKGSVIIDLAGGAGGNAEGSLFGKKIEIDNTLIYSPKNLPSLLANDSSLLYSKNVLNFLNQFIREDKKFDINSDDEILKDITIRSEMARVFDTDSLIKSLKLNEQLNTDIESLIRSEHILDAAPYKDPLKEPVLDSIVRGSRMCSVHH